MRKQKRKTLGDIVCDRIKKFSKNNYYIADFVDEMELIDVINKELLKITNKYCHETCTTYFESIKSQK